MLFKPTAALLTLASANFEELVQFYVQFLCQKPVSLIPNTYAEFHLPGVRLGIFRPKIGRDKAESVSVEQASTFNSATGFYPSASRLQASLSMSLCLEVDDLTAAIAHLTAIGYPPSGDVIIASHGREIYAFDPDGNRLILHEGIQQ